MEKQPGCHLGLKIPFDQQWEIGPRIREKETAPSGELPVVAAVDDCSCRLTCPRRARRRTRRWRRRRWTRLLIADVA